ncbi:MAG: hypothetical protein ABIO57_03760 [Candidatus Paceibacterota bacterium]
MGHKEKGIDDARAGKPYEEPTKDLIDHVGLGYSNEEIKNQKDDYGSGYEIGTAQRVADSNEKKD